MQPQYRPLEGEATTDADVGDDGDDDDEEDIDPAAVDQDQSVVLDLEEDAEDVDGFVSDMQSAMDIFREQRAAGNDRFVRKFMAANASNQRLVQEVKTLQNQRTMRRTWNAWKHPATMYYR